MNTEYLLITALSVLSLLLGVMLYVRILSQKRQMGIIRRMDLAAFSEFLRSNSHDGNIQVIAGGVSTFLSKTFGCNRIIFLRKKRGILELNYYYGISGFNRRDFELSLKSDLSEKLSKDFLPLKIENIKLLVPQKFYENLISKGVEIYFPVYWRNNLYGIYFVNRTNETLSPAFTLLIASLAHSLSAAYHIKWHESRQLDLENKLENSAKQISKEKKTPDSREVTVTRLLPLIKIKDTSILTPRIVNAVGEDLNFTNVSFFYGDGKKIDGQKQISKGINKTIGALEAGLLKNLSGKVKKHGAMPIGELKNSPDATAHWLKQLRESGLEYIAAFPSSGKEEGIMAWSGPKPSKDLESGLTSYRRFAEDLFENAEAFHKTEKLSYTDALTGLSNQRYMYKRLEEEINRAKRYGRPLAFIIIDIDELKSINDSLGHQAGDALIKQVGQSLKKSIRAIDIVSRYGGDEFCVVMPESDQATCVKFMQRMLDTISKTDITLEGQLQLVHCSVSLGGALFPEHAQDAQKLIYAADMALLAAKASGRNRLLVYDSNMAKLDV